MPIVEPAEDPKKGIRQRRRQIEAAPTPDPVMDEKEKAERAEALKAYGGEDPSHFVAFLKDQVKVSVDSMREIRREQAECWDIYNEKEPASYNYKESWQSRALVPKPFASVQFFLALVRKAFDPRFLSIENEQNKDAAHDIQKLMELQLSRSVSNFPINFTDATGMAAAVGQSMEMIPSWRPGRGLEWHLIEPAKIHRDPDSLSRRSQSGMFWVHEEWLDYYDLREKEKSGRFSNIPNFGPGGNWGNPQDSENLTKEQLAMRKEMYFQRSQFRGLILTQEYWGTVLAPNGEMLMPNAWFTVAGDQVIGPPKPSPYPTLRWPGTGFSPLPHLLRFDGRSLLQSIKSLWYFMCNLMALHADNLNWAVNPPTEICVENLVDPFDIDDFPGHQWLTKTTAQGQQVIRTVDRKSNTGDILANLNKADMMYQEGSMLNYASQGLPGYRAEVTARESSQNLEQSMTVVGYMGENLEDGALSAIEAAWETITANITYKELAMMMGEEFANKYRDDSKKETGLRLPQLTSGAFKASGVATTMRNQEIISAITNVVLPLYQNELFIPYVKPYGLLKAVEIRLNLQDEGLFVEKEKADEIDQAQQQGQDAAIEEKKKKEEADRIKAENEALKHGAHADKLHAEADANREQAGLFGAQAGAVAAQPPGEVSQGVGGGVPPEMIPPEGMMQ